MKRGKGRKPCLLLWEEHMTFALWSPCKAELIHQGLTMSPGVQCCLLPYFRSWLCEEQSSVVWSSEIICATLGMAFCVSGHFYVSPITKLWTVKIILAQFCLPYLGSLKEVVKWKYSWLRWWCWHKHVRVGLGGHVCLTLSSGKIWQNHHDSSYVSFPSYSFKMKVFNTNAAKWALCWFMLISSMDAVILRC